MGNFHRTSGTSLHGKTVFSLNKEHFSENIIRDDELKQKVKEIAGISFERKLTAAVYTGKIPKEEYEVKKYFLENDKNDFVLPLYVIQNLNSKTEKTLVWLPEAGKQDVLENPLLTELLAKNFTIVTADLPDIGELSDPEFRGDGFVKGVPFNYTFGANLVGKSIPGIRAEAIDLLNQFVQSQFPDTKVDALAEGGLSEALLHYSVLKQGISKMVLEHVLESNRSLIQTEYYDPRLAYNVVPGSLPFYDFPDLVKLLPSGSVKVINPVNAKGEETCKNESDSTILEFLNRE